MSRNLFSLVLAICLPGALAACGGGDPVSDAAVEYDAAPPDATPLAAIGAACDSDEDCLGGACYDERVGFPSDGYCTSENCDVNAAATSCLPFGGDSYCVDFGQPGAPAGLCVDLCEPGGTDCRPGYFCVPIDPYFCAPI